MASLMLARGRSTRFHPEESAELLTEGPRGGCGDGEDVEDVEDVEGWEASESDISGARFSCSSLFAPRTTIYCLFDDNVPQTRRGRHSGGACGNAGELHACPNGSGPAAAGPDRRLRTDLDKPIGILYCILWGVWGGGHAPYGVWPPMHSPFAIHWLVDLLDRYRPEKYSLKLSGIDGEFISHSL